MNNKIVKSNDFITEIIATNVQVYKINEYDQTNQQKLKIRTLKQQKPYMFEGQQQIKKQFQEVNSGYITIGNSQMKQLKESVINGKNNTSNNVVIDDSQIKSFNNQVNNYQHIIDDIKHSQSINNSVNMSRFNKNQKKQKLELTKEALRSRSMQNVILQDTTQPGIRRNQSVKVEFNEDDFTKKFHYQNINVNEDIEYE